MANALAWIRKAVGMHIGQSGRGRERRDRRFSTAALLASLVLCVFLSGCSVVGPRVITNGRLTYSEAIGVTNNQQILMAVVRNRYAQASAMLAVASVTANVKVSTSAGIQVGAGDSDNYAGNLVPFSAGGVYEENPTISYAPVAGSEYIRGFTAPFSVSTLAQLSTAMIDPAPIYYALVAEMNGLRNPDFLFPGVALDPRFDRAVSILVRLHQSRSLHWVSDPGNEEEVRIVIGPRQENVAAEVRELMDLLGLSAPEMTGSLQTISLVVGTKPDGADSRDADLRITTRSVFRLLEVLSAAVQPPPQDDADGASIHYPQLGRVGERLSIRYGAKRPQRAALAVPYRDGWFYIDERDQATKVFFRIVETLWSAVMADSAAQGPSGPLLTVPVSG